MTYPTHQNLKVDHIAFDCESKNHHLQIRHQKSINQPSKTMVLDIHWHQLISEYLLLHQVHLQDK